MALLNAGALLDASWLCLLVYLDRRGPSVAPSPYMLPTERESDGEEDASYEAFFFPPRTENLHGETRRGRDGRRKARNRLRDSSRRCRPTDRCLSKETAPPSRLAYLTSSALPFYWQNLCFGLNSAAACAGTSASLRLSRHMDGQDPWPYVPRHCFFELKCPGSGGGGWFSAPDLTVGRWVQVHGHLGPELCPAEEQRHRADRGEHCTYGSREVGPRTLPNWRTLNGRARGCRPCRWASGSVFHRVLISFSRICKPIYYKRDVSSDDARISNIRGSPPLIEDTRIVP